MLGLCAWIEKEKEKVTPRGDKMHSDERVWTTRDWLEPSDGHRGVCPTRPDVFTQRPEGIFDSSVMTALPPSFLSCLLHNLF